MHQALAGRWLRFPACQPPRSLLCWLLPLALASAQTAGTDVTTSEEPANFSARTNLVVVRAVVRDRQGHAVGNLHKEDFQILDRGKPQVIANFSVETAPPEIVKKPANGTLPPAPETQTITADTPGPPVPDRFIAYLFDDVHISNEDLMTVRQAALRHLDTVDANTRIALYTTSGRNPQEFTDDRAVIKAALAKIMAHPTLTRQAGDCPDISYYLADLIANKQMQDAIDMEAEEYLICNSTPDPSASAKQQAAMMVQQLSRTILSQGEYETRITLDTLNKVVRRIGAMPGQRTVVVVSPGFLIREERTAVSDVIDRAIRENVIISSLDARGLYVLIPGGDASHPGSALPPAYQTKKFSYDAADASETSDILAELADSTGGLFFHNNNGFEEGFKRVAGRPETIYVLGFSPKDLKSDGSYHNLKVKLIETRNVTLQARRGYFAPRKNAKAEDDAKYEIEDALFSPQEIRSIPILLRTQFFKTGDVDAKLSVLARIDVRGLKFRKADGRNNDNLTVVSGLFDRNGNYISASQKLIQMHLKDTTMQEMFTSGLVMKTSFDVKPGDYLVRLVVRDSEGQMLSAVSGSVQIP